MPEQIMGEEDLWLMEHEANTFSSSDHLRRLIAAYRELRDARPNTALVRELAEAEFDSVLKAFDKAYLNKNASLAASIRVALEAFIAIRAARLLTRPDGIAVRKGGGA